MFSFVEPFLKFAKKYVFNMPRMTKLKQHYISAHMIN